MAEARISYIPRSDALDVAEATALANAYHLILDNAMKRGRLPDKSGPDDGTNIKEDSANEHRST